MEQHLRNLTVPVGQDAKFEIRFQSKQEAEVTWYRNEEELTDSNRIDILSPEVNFYCKAKFLLCLNYLTFFTGNAKH